MIDKRRVRLHFDRHAGEYEQYADVQREMADRLAAIISEQAAATDGRHRAGGIGRIFEIGCGTGRFTQMLAAAFPAAQIVCIDLSGRMLAVAREKLLQERPGDAARVIFLEGDAESIVAKGCVGPFGRAAEGPDRFDLIVSNAAFQWFNSPCATVKACIKLLKPAGGTLAYSTFLPGTFRQLNASFAEAERRLKLAPVPHGQSFPGRDDWRACFAREAGRFRWEEKVRTVEYPSVRTFLHQVKRIGAGNAAAGGSRGVGGRRRIEEMERVYAGSFAAPYGRGIEADYAIGFGTFVRNADGSDGGDAG